jgi:anti-sigma factor RsiW
MTCAECRDLLLDLAYGELAAERAAEVEAHLAQCPECREERARLDRTRKLVAPLRAVEEPPASFDEPILRAVRTEATMQADGTPGTVVEVSASVKPLGLQPARVDPHAEVNVARKPSKGRWTRRIAVAGSVAAAASLALVVGVSLQSRPQRTAEEVPALTVRAPVVPSAVDEARQNAHPPPAARESIGGAAGAPPHELAKKEATPPEPPNARPQISHKTKIAQLPDGLAKPQAPVAERPGAEEQPTPPRPDATQPARSGAHAKASALRSQSAQPTPPLPAAAEQNSRQQAHDDVASVGAAQEAKGLAAGTAPNASAAAPRDADAMETSAETSRRAGRYEAAAQLYRDAAAARRSSGDATRAAWNLAHAVECLAAASRLDEATRVRDDLLRDFPREEGPRRAADRALGYPQR